MDTTEKVPSTRERQAQQRREKIIQASMQLFWEKCVEDTSMEEVAKCSGVGVATVYRYFSTKIELVICLTNQEYPTTLCAPVHEPVRMFAGINF